MCHALFSHLLVLPSSGPVFEEGAAAHRTQGVGITATERGADALGYSTSAVTAWVSKLVESIEFHLCASPLFCMVLRNIISVPCGKAADK